MSSRPVRRHVPIMLSWLPSSFYELPTRWRAAMSSVTTCLFFFEHCFLDSGVYPEWMDLLLGYLHGSALLLLFFSRTLPPLLRIWPEDFYDVLTLTQWSPIVPSSTRRYMRFMQESDHREVACSDVPRLGERLCVVPVCFAGVFTSHREVACSDVPRFGE